MTQEWYYQQNGQKHGPISGAILKQIAAAGKLQPTDLIWKEGMAKWVSARSVKGLFPAASATVATAAPPPPVKAASPVADGAGEVVEVVPASAKPSLQERVMGLVAKMKRLWQSLGTPARVGIVGGAVGGVFLLLLLFCVLPLWWFFGGSGGTLSIPGQDQAVRQGSGSYTDKAMKTPMAKRFKGKLKDVHPGSRDDFIQALAVLGTPLESQGRHQRQGDDGRVHSMIVYAAADVQSIHESTYEAVFGKPKIVSEVMFGEVFKGWQHQCTDGQVNVGGSLPDPTAFPKMRVYHVTSIITPLD